MRRPHRRRGAGSWDAGKAGIVDLCRQDAAGDAGPAADRDPWDDPGRLIEAYAAGRRYRSHEPETVVIAWLSILSPAIAPPVAARSLLDRLERAAASLSDRQPRLLDLLAHVAAHGRVPAVGPIGTNRPRTTEGQGDP